MPNADKELIDAIHRLAAALEKGRGAASEPVFENGFGAYVYEAERGALRPVERVATPKLDLLMGIDRAKATLLENTRRFARGLSANNALLWGARGMGKSTLIKAVQAALLEEYESAAPALIEIHREDIAALPGLLRRLRGLERRFIVYCDDLSFNNPDTDFKALKSVLEGGLEGRPDNVVFYATSNRRHLLPRAMMDQESAIGIHPNESMDETIALSDRFGLWLGFHPCDQADYLAMIEAYLTEFGLKATDWQADALEWSKTRGNRSGRTAWQFVVDFAGRKDLRVGF